MYVVERWRLVDGPQGSEQVPDRVGEFPDFVDALVSFLGAVGADLGVGVHVTRITVGMSTASATVSDSLSGDDWEYVVSYVADRL